MRLPFTAMKLNTVYSKNRLVLKPVAPSGRLVASMVDMLASTPAKAAILPSPAPSSTDATDPIRLIVIVPQTVTVSTTGDVCQFQLAFIWVTTPLVSFEYVIGM